MTLIEKKGKMRIFIAEADQDVRVGLQMLLNRQPGLQVVGIATRSDGLVGGPDDEYRSRRPAIVVTSWARLPVKTSKSTRPSE